MQKDHTALREVSESKMKATLSVLKNCESEESVFYIATKLYTLLVDTSAQEMGSTLSLTLSEGNRESGHHYIILSGYKFKLE